MGGGEQECINVTIIDDEILENTEVFRVVMLPSNDSAITFESTVLSVGIENDDSKLKVKGANFTDCVCFCRCGSGIPRGYIHCE